MSGGSIAITFLVSKEDEARTRDVLHGAGFLVRTTEVEAGMAVAAERYVGIPRPEAELQTAHHEAAQAALDGEGIVYAVTGTGLEMNGGEQPLWAVAVLGGVFPAEAREQIAERGVWKPRFLGSCFAFRHSNTFLTAAHCVEGIRPEDLIVECPGLG